MTDKQRKARIEFYAQQAARMYEAGRIDLAHEALEKMEALKKKTDEARK